MLHVFGVLYQCRLWLNGLYAVTIRLHDGRLRVPRIFVFSLLGLLIALVSVSGFRGLEALGLGFRV